MMRFRTESDRTPGRLSNGESPAGPPYEGSWLSLRVLAIAAVLGALFGVLLYVDWLTLPEDAHELVATPPVRGAAWHVFGTAALAVALVVIVRGLDLAGFLRWRRRRELVHAKHCAARYPVRGTANRCTCGESEDPRNWPPARRRAALKVLDGGRS